MFVAFYRVSNIRILIDIYKYNNLLRHPTITERVREKEEEREKDINRLSAQYLIGDFTNHVERQR